MQTPEAAVIDETRPVESTARPPVIRNAMFLVIAQVIVTPISVIVNAVAARHLGPADFGRMYLATTLATFALLFVEWGQTGALTGKVAIDRGRAGELLGSGLTWRLGAAAAVFIILPLGCLLAGYEWSFIQVLLLALCGTTLLTIANACQDVFRGFERTDFAAASYVGWQLLSAVVSIPTLLLGGGIVALLTAQAACAAVSAIFVLKMLPRMNVPHLSMRAATVKELFLAGRGFLAFLVVIALQPVIDVAMLSKFGSADSMGWHAAARKLVGILIYPASALVAALYPTLCRLQMSDQPAFRKTAADAFHVTTIAVMPLALGCALFPDIGIMIFSEQSYGPAEDNLRLLAIYILLVYFSMPIGTCLASIGRQSLWAGVQFACIIVSAICDPPLIKYFQETTGNGGLGVCVATVFSEILMVSAGLYLLPKGILDRAVLMRLAAAVLAGAVMAAIAVSLKSFFEVNVFVRATFAVLGYLGALRLFGAINAAELRSMVGMLRRRKAEA
jgi:O-antigen/teichoic acid export membrane protein